MKILFVGNFGYKKNYHQFYNCDYKFYFGLIRNNHSVYQFSNRDLARQEGFFKSRFGSENSVNKKLIKTVRELKPEIIFLSHCDMIRNETLQIIREENKNIKIAEINVDALWVEHIKKYLLERAAVLDALFLTTSGDQLNDFKKVNPELKVSYIPNPVDSSIDTGKGFEKTDHEYDIFFGGRGDYRTPTLHYVKTNLPEVKFNVLGLWGKDITYGQKYLDEMRKCHTGLNLPQFVEDIYQPPLYSSDRIAQIFGNGLLTIIHEKTQLQTMFEPDVEAVYYSEWEDLAEKIQKFTIDKGKRNLIAEKGWNKYHMLYNSKNITQDMVDLVNSN